MGEGLRAGKVMGLQEAKCSPLTRLVITLEVTSNRWNKTLLLSSLPIFRFLTGRWRCGSSFLNGEDLSDVWIGLYKVIVNPPKFQRKSAKPLQPFNPIPVGREGLEGASKSFGDYCHPAGFNGNWKKVLLNEAQLVDKPLIDVLEFKVSNERLIEMKEMIVGELERVEDIFSIHALLVKEGFRSIKAIPAGGRWVLLKGRTSDDLIDVQRVGSWSSKIFKSFRPYSTSFSYQERIAWVKCIGVPAQAWSEEFFRLLANSLGSFVKLDNDTKEMNRLNVGGFFVLMKGGSVVDSSQKVKVDDHVVSVRLIEAVGDYVIGGLEGGSYHLSLNSKVNHGLLDSVNSDLHSWQDRDSCWGEHILLEDEEDDEVADSLVNETNPHLATVQNLAILDGLASVPVKDNREVFNPLLPYPPVLLPILEDSLPSKRCSQGVMPFLVQNDEALSDYARLEEVMAGNVSDVAVPFINVEGLDKNIPLVGSIDITTVNKISREDVGHSLVGSLKELEEGIGLDLNSHSKNKSSLGDFCALQLVNNKACKKGMKKKHFRNSIFKVGSGSKSGVIVQDSIEACLAIGNQARNSRGNLKKGKSKFFMPPCPATRSVNWRS
ncbi:hypothetical protein TanjilG_20910 [Lupinus angustifolius]|uniref:Uncharacterized protein n=1 Tax=Lupinus angustifolius TaxID=3871 RepID=A0A1J7GER3_LUPAN|nr:hypothetical protein TanjilG_20910 [Lupinus angustifolius]